MDSKIAKVLGSSHRVMLGLKRKRASSGFAYCNGASHILSSEWPTLNFHKAGKRQRLRGSQNKHVSCGNHSRKYFLRLYSNFTRTGVPQHLMYYKNGGCNDFPQDIVASIMKDLQDKKLVVEVEVEGHGFVLDFLHMLRLDRKTGLSSQLHGSMKQVNASFQKYLLMMRKNMTAA